VLQIWLCLIRFEEVMHKQHVSFLVIISAIVVVPVLVLWVPWTREVSLLPLAFLEDEYSSVASKISALENRQLIAKGNGAEADVAEIDRQLASLKAKLAELKQAVVERRLQQEAAAKRQEQDNAASDPEQKYSSIASQINALEIRQLIAKGNGAGAEVAQIDKQLAPLRAQLAALQPGHEQALAERRLQQEAEAKRQEQQEIEAIQKKEADLKKRCEDIKSKRIVDLTVNDIELLKACTVPVPHLPL
jgi:hypothetical protein